MKKTVLIIAAAMSAMPAFAQSESAGKGAEKAEPAADIAGLDLRTRIQLMKQFDRDGDGRLS